MSSIYDAVAEVDVARLDICNALALEWEGFSTEQEIGTLTSARVIKHTAHYEEDNCHGHHGVPRAR